MDKPAKNLFSLPASLALVAEWGLEPTQEQLTIHQALANRDLTPDEPHLRAAAAWLSAFYKQNQRSPRFEPFDFAQVLSDKTSLILRLAYDHVPALAAEFELETSPIHPIEAAARFLPPTETSPSSHLESLRQHIAEIQLPEAPPKGSDPTWHENRRRLQQLILHHNPLRFLSWPVILNSMFMNNLQIATPEIAALQSRPDYQDRWNLALREDSLGAPARTPLHPDSSNNLIHHAYNLLQLESHANLRIDQLHSILEFGGGYGSTARLALRLGFRGTYTIFDLPEFSALQQYFLGTLGFPLNILATPSIRCITSFTELRDRLLDNPPDLFLATWSLSETPLHIREAFLPTLLSSKLLLIAYQDTFNEIDNLSYFKTLAQQLPNHTIHDDPIPHLQGNRYFVAITK